MFLALKEIKHEKMRYGLIVFMIFLVAYLIFAVWSMAYGLARENTVAIEDWKVKSVVLNENSNLSMNSSYLTKTDVANAKLSNKEAYVGELQTVVKKKNRLGLNAQYMGVKRNEFIYKSQKLVSGRKAKTEYEITADTRFRDKGYKLGDKVTLNGSDHKYKIVGFVKDAKINIEPIIYGSLGMWKTLKNAAPNVVASGIFSKRNFKINAKNVKTYKIDKFIQKLPGYSEQNMSFEMMIAFMFIISLIIVAVFLYILTIQKLPNYAVLRVQGIPTKTLINATISQGLILVVSGVIIALIAMQITGSVMPPTVPMEFTPKIMLSGSLGMLIMGLIGGLAPIRTILKIDPVAAIGG